jgi:hypothetical protein
MGASGTGPETHEKRRVKAPQTTSIPDEQPTHAAGCAAIHPGARPHTRAHHEKGRGCKDRGEAGRQGTSADKYANPRGLTRLSDHLGTAFQPTKRKRHKPTTITA